MCGYELFIKWQWHSEQRQEQEQVVTMPLECLWSPKKGSRTLCSYRFFPIIPFFLDREIKKHIIILKFL